MLSKVHSGAVYGVDAYPVEIEVNSGGGDPQTVIVGLPDAAVKESKDRVHTAIINSEFDMPKGRLTINLAPADIKKEGPLFDLPIAMGVLGIALGLSLIFTACETDSGTTDYSKPEHWLSLPASPAKNVDVFYLYPTSFQKSNDNEPNICEIDNASMLAKSKEAFATQATAFETVANIYAPYYRQVDAAYCLKLPLDEQAEIIGDIPASDAMAAFDYYIKNYNKGRPFILAGHSQGSNVMLYLLAEYMQEHPEVYAGMIAAYVIGYSVTPGYLAANPHLKFVAGPADTGVIVSYNTEAPEVVGNNPVLLPGAMVINPITWTRTEKLATAAENLGSIVVDAEGKIATVKNYADARVDTNRGVVICSTVDVEKLAPGNPVFGKGVYHEYDYQFYYFNLRENAANRTGHFSNKQ